METGGLEYSDTDSLVVKHRCSFYQPGLTAVLACAVVAGRLVELP